MHKSTQTCESGASPLGCDLCKLDVGEVTISRKELKDLKTLMGRVLPMVEKWESDFKSGIPRTTPDGSSSPKDYADWPNKKLKFHDVLKGRDYTNQDEEAMSAEHKLVLRSQYLWLWENVDVDGKLVPFLYQEGVLQEHDKQKINEERTKSLKTEILLDILPKKGNNAFFYFCLGLEKNGQSFISKRLTQLHSSLTHEDNCKESDKLDQKFSVEILPGLVPEDVCNSLIERGLKEHTDLKDSPVYLREECLTISNARSGCVLFTMNFSRVEQLDEYWIILNNKSFYKTFARQLLSIVLPEELRYLSRALSLKQLSVMTFENYIGLRRKFTKGKLCNAKDAESILENSTEEIQLKERILCVERENRKLEDLVNKQKADLIRFRPKCVIEKEDVVPRTEDEHLNSHAAQGSMAIGEKSTSYNEDDDEDNVNECDCIKGETLADDMKARGVSGPPLAMPIDPDEQAADNASTDTQNQTISEANGSGRNESTEAPGVDEQEALDDPLDTGKEEKDKASDGYLKATFGVDEKEMTHLTRLDDGQNMSIKISHQAKVKEDQGESTTSPSSSKEMLRSEDGKDEPISTSGTAKKKKVPTATRR